MGDRAGAPRRRRDSPLGLVRKPGADWIASWRLTRRQLETVARGALPRKFVTWAKRDLQAIADPAAWYIQRTSTKRQLREKR